MLGHSKQVCLLGKRPQCLGVGARARAHAGEPVFVCWMLQKWGRSVSAQVGGEGSTQIGAGVGGADLRQRTPKASP